VKSDLEDLSRRAIALPGWKWPAGIYAVGKNRGALRRGHVTVESDGSPSLRVSRDFTRRTSTRIMLDDAWPVLDSPTAGGALLLLLDGNIRAERSTRHEGDTLWYVAEKGTGNHFAFGEGLSLGEACARLALARGYWRKGATDAE